MPEKKRDKKRLNLASTDYRRRLPKRKEYYWLKLEKGVYIGYRSANSTWHARIRKNGQTHKRIIGNADTYRDADRETILTYRDACRLAQGLADSDELEPPRPVLAYTVADAAADYLDYAKARTKSHRETERMIRTRIIAPLGKIPVDELTAKRIERWMHALARSKPQARPAIITNPETGKQIRQEKYLVLPELDEHEKLRRRQATANRTLNVLKAMLNRAWEHGDASSLEWKKVKPFEGVSKPVERFLTEAECKRLLDKLDDDFAELVTGLLLTGARYSELRQTRVRDFNRASASLLVTRPKRRGSGTRRITLSKEACALLDGLTAGRDGGAYIFVRSKDGKPWGTSHQFRRMRKACEAAEIDPPVGVHVLRHSVASHYLKRGLGLKLIAEALGHTNIAITSRHYAHVEEKQLRRALDRHGMRLVSASRERESR